MNSYVKIMKIDNLNTIVIKQEGDKNFFVTTKDSLIISVPHLSYLLKYMLFSKVLNPKLLEGVLREYYDSENSE